MDAADQPPAEMRGALTRMGLLAPHERLVATPLTGGVSSDIWKVETASRTFAVKRALAQLKVAAEWRAPVARNAYEVSWFRTAGAIVPPGVPAILGEDREAGLFAMAYLDPAHHPVWKFKLRDGRVSMEAAAQVGERLGRIHAASARRNDIAAAFDTDATFHAIRLEPYLEATARAHPRLRDTLFALSAETLATKRALVHGDVSPKNILIGPQGPVFLDAECAWYGDPAFDLAFCLNHLLLKCLWTPRATSEFLWAFETLASAYLARVDWEDAAALEARTARLLPALLLARVDGKSPVEYLDAAGKAKVRGFAPALVLDPPSRLAAIRARWTAAVSLSPLAGRR